MILKYLNIIQKDVNRPIIEDIKEKKQVQKGINYTDLEYSALPLSLNTNNDTNAVKIVRLKNKEVKI